MRSYPTRRTVVVSVVLIDIIDDGIVGYGGTAWVNVVGMKFVTEHKHKAEH